ncbi:FKBP-type peptidyl-prolyl cis-trans isomerase [Crocinitomix algicola]|uniref:FKBP-type peptidyl-prolyl cis-trans isomerase n=1 Tax=Crocinitomix algicola TaxID=1740263 RepID=UPI0008314C67|nr:FKBP-type peptidyl-prolyl cis-trans isomerase [Crocinitomix algicola]
MKYFIIAFILIFSVSSCAKKRAEKQAKEDETIIQNYIAKHELEATATGSGLYYTVETPGEGASCDANSTVRVAYKGYLTSGTVFDESEPEGATFGLLEVIEGWTEGIPLYKEGGKGTLIIPSALGYGENGRGTIPDNAVLIFDIELIEVL